MSPVSDLTYGRPLVERIPSESPGGRSAPPEIELLITEVATLAGLLAQVVEMAGRAAIFPGHWEALAELAMEHASVRAALAAGDVSTGGRTVSKSDSTVAARPTSPGVR
ncbi:MAG: hypothetical protein JO287_07670 [Pseudonocardiales bacterium]|nr:hypothetical protein [Pseudonocardiales bacterium]